MNTSLRVSAVSLLVGALIIPVVALAAEIRTGQTTSFSASEVSKGNLYLVGGNVSSAGRVVGDLMVAGGTISVSGPVAQDLFIGGGNLAIVSDVGGDLRGAGGNIIVNGRVGGDVVLAGGSVQIAGSGVGGDILSAGGSLQVLAPVLGNMQLAGGEVTINSHVRGNVEFKGKKLVLGKDAVIDGNLTYSAQSEATMEAGALVKGKTTYEPLKTASTTPAITPAGIIAIFSVVLLGKFLATLLFALVLGLYFRRYTQTLVGTATAQPLAEMGRGLIVFIVLPVLSVLALVTLIGIPFGVLGLLAFGILMLVTSAFAAILAGSIAHKWIFKPAEYRVAWQTILLGVIIVTVLGFIPLVGWLVKAALFLLALGSIVKLKWTVAKEWR